MKYAFTDFNDLVALDEIDAVSVCTWNNAHAAAAIAASKAGKHVLCEAHGHDRGAGRGHGAGRPPERQGVHDGLLQPLPRRHPDSQGPRRGRHLRRHLLRQHRLAAPARHPLGWFTDVEKSGGGPVIDIGVHVIDLTWYIMGKPRPISVSATTYNKIGDYQTKGVGRWVAFDTDNLKFNTEDSANGIIRFEGGKEHELPGLLGDQRRGHGRFSPRFMATRRAPTWCR